MTRKMIPVTMLSGFLGSGKTTLLRHLLEQDKERIGCVVNDVASINIDAKLIRNDRSTQKGQTSTADLADTVELANGCACCSIQDELFSSFEQLLSVAERKGIVYDRFVLENSGVAEPQNLRDKFNEAIFEGHPVMTRIRLDTMITIVDSGTFIKDYSSRTALAARPDLGEGGTLRPVVDLLVEQIECADIVLLNKKDLLESGELASLTEIVHTLNPMAQVSGCEHGRVDLEKVFGPETKGLIAHMNTEGQHRGAVAAARAAAAKAVEHQKESQMLPDPEKRSAHHDHKHTHDHKHETCSDPNCSIETKQGHKHEHKLDTNNISGNAHLHEHQHAAEHGHKVHDHDHAHSNKRQETTAAARFGIVSFVYSRRRPFHPQRLRDMVLKWLPVTQNSALEGQTAGTGNSPIKAVLRSKGFMWMSYSHASAFYWSHAGQHFDIRDEGDWWACVPDDEWPMDPNQRQVIISDFDLETDFGDRRQEIVFIGAKMDEKAIHQQLDTALLTDAEMIKYRERYATEPDPEHPDVKLIQDRSKKQRT